MLVDDDPIMRELAAAKLAEAGYDTILASDGAQALSMLGRTTADLIISDLDMPVMDGYELTRRIRSSQSLNETPVIVITASDHSEAVEDAFAAGATSFLTKPINWALFAHAILFVLKASSDQKELRLARDQAEAGARFKDNLLSIISHELRTPLNAIIGFGQLLSDQFQRENDHMHRDYADHIVGGGKRLLNSVSDLLLASEARSNPIAIDESACAIGDIFKLAQSSLVAPPADAAISLAVEDDRQRLRCDKGLIARAVAKLMDNAIKFSPPGVKVAVGAAQTKDGRLAFVIKDNGPGISAEKLAVLRQPFEQLDMSLHRSKEGLGLGLPLVQAIMAAHGGEFRLDSKPGGGACAVLLFPKSRLEDAPTKGEARSSSAAA